MPPLAGFGSALRVSWAAAAWSGRCCWRGWRPSLDFVPLFDVLGYDFSFALGLAAALAAVDLGRGGRGPLAGGRGRGQPVARAAGAAAAGRPTRPSARWRCSCCRCCSRSRTRCACATAASRRAGVLRAAARRAPRSTPRRPACWPALMAPRRGRLLAFALPVRLARSGRCLRLYRDPPVFAFDPFGGYFPGPIYDEALRPPARAAVVPRWPTSSGSAPPWPSRSPPPDAGWIRGAGGGARSRAALPLVAGVGACSSPAAGRSAFTSRRARPRARARRARSHRALRRSTTRRRRARRRPTLALARRGPRVPLPPAASRSWASSRRPPSRSGSSRPPRSKKALVGAGNTLYAKPWTREIFMQGERFPSPRLRHEMAHVFAGAFGDPLFGIALALRWRGRCPSRAWPWASSKGWPRRRTPSDPDGDATIHEEAAAMIAAGLAPPLAAVVGAGFSDAGGRARLHHRRLVLPPSCWRRAAPSRCARSTARPATSATSTGRRSPTSSADGAQFLAPPAAHRRASGPTPARSSGGPAIFKRVCARELAARVAEARGLERGDPAAGRAPARSRPAATIRDEPTYRLALAAGAKRSRASGPAALDAAGAARRSTTTSPCRCRARRRRWRRRSSSTPATTSTPSPRSGARSSWARPRTAIGARRWPSCAASPTPRRATTLGRALYGDELGGAGADPVLTFFFLQRVRAPATRPTRSGPYLVGAAAARPRIPPAPCPTWPRLRRRGVPPPAGRSALPPEFLRECRRMTADAAYRTGRLRARARRPRLGWPPMPSGEADRLRALDMRARVDWAAERRAGAVGAVRD